jgi:hypothetical protein
VVSLKNRKLATAQGAIPVLFFVKFPTPNDADERCENSEGRNSIFSENFILEKFEAGVGGH